MLPKCYHMKMIPLLPQNGMEMWGDITRRVLKMERGMNYCVQSRGNVPRP